MPTALGSLAVLVARPGQILEPLPGSMLNNGMILPENLAGCRGPIDISPTPTCGSKI